MIESLEDGSDRNDSIFNDYKQEIFLTFMELLLEILIIK